MTRAMPNPQHRPRNKMTGMAQALLHSPIGILAISATDREVVSIRMVKNNERIEPSIPVPDILHRCIEQLSEYFAGKRRKFDIPLAQSGTAFSQNVWRSLSRVPFGDVRSYSQIAASIRRPSAMRAVGNACNRNPHLIVVPCHRIVHSNGSLFGFACGDKAKEWLLNHEKNG